MSIFRADGPFCRFLERIANLMILNIVFLLCCIPVVTIGPALTALYYVAMKINLKEEQSILRDFFHAFRLNFRQGLLLFLIVLAIGAFWGVDLYLLFFSSAIPEAHAKWLSCAIVVIGVLLFAPACYTFPILARFHVTLGGCLKASIGTAVAHLPTTISVVAIALIPVMMIFLPMIHILHIVIPVFLLIGFALLAYFQSWFFLRAFRSHTPDAASADSES